MPSVVVVVVRLVHLLHGHLLGFRVVVGTKIKIKRQIIAVNKTFAISLSVVVVSISVVVVDGSEANVGGPEVVEAVDVVVAKVPPGSVINGNCVAS